MNSCENFFTTNSTGKKCKLLQEISVDVLIEWESLPASPLSPGPVGDSEVLYHQILNPTNLLDSKDGINAKSFETTTGIGMSTHRIDHTNIEKIIELGKKRADAHNLENPNNPQPRSLWGFIRIPVARVRALISDVSQARGLFVYDTALPNDISHADICQSVKDRDLRLSLYDLVKGSAFPLPTPSE